MLALDLFCKAGGASDGMANAGLSVIGIDIEPQPNYPYPFIQGDVLKVNFKNFDFIWASPPCQGFTAYRRNGKVKDYPNLIPQIREKLKDFKGGWIIENVEGAPLNNAITLCGSMFGLDVRRHRIFESNFRISPLKCRHDSWMPRFAPASNRVNLRKTVEVGVYRIPLEIQKKAMGIHRKISLNELSNAIPPAYSKYIVEQWMINRSRATILGKL